MTYEQWLEESKINEIPADFRQEFIEATKAAWDAGQMNMLDESCGIPPKNEVILWRNIERVMPNLFVPRIVIEKFVLELDRMRSA